MAPLFSSTVAVFESFNVSRGSFVSGSCTDSSRREMLIKKKYAGIIEKANKALEANQTSSSNTVGRCSYSTLDHLPATQTLCTKSVADTERVSKKRKNEAADHHSAAQTRCTKSAAVVVDTEGVSKKKKKKNETEELKRKDLERKAEIQKMREAARRKVERMSMNVDIDDPQQVLRDFNKLVGYNNKDRAMYQYVSLLSYGSNALLFKSSDVRKLTRNSVCCDKYIESSRSTTDKCQVQAMKVGGVTIGDELEEGEIPNDDEVEEGEITD